DKVGVVPCPSGDQFPAQARIFVHFQHVYARMGRAERNRLRQRERPTLRRLVRQPGDQVDVDVGKTSLPQTGYFLKYRGAFVQPSDRLRLLIDEGLHAQAYAVDASAQQSLD